MRVQSCMNTHRRWRSSITIYLGRVLLSFSEGLTEIFKEDIWTHSSMSSATAAHSFHLYHPSWRVYSHSFFQSSALGNTLGGIVWSWKQALFRLCKGLKMLFYSVQQARIQTDQCISQFINWINSFLILLREKITYPLCLMEQLFIVLVLSTKDKEMLL